LLLDLGTSHSQVSIIAHRLALRLELSLGERLKPDDASRLHLGQRSQRSHVRDRIDVRDVIHCDVVDRRNSVVLDQCRLLEQIARRSRDSSFLSADVYRAQVAVPRRIIAMRKPVVFE
jgi:hypothetical protein